MKKPDINQFAATLFRNYEPGENDESFYSDRFEKYLKGFEKRKQPIPTITDKQFIELERGIIRRLLESDDLDSANTRFALRYRDILKSGTIGSKVKNEQEPKSKPTLKHIALIYVYQEMQITKENADTIANNYGHKSGHKLYQTYNEYRSQANRKGEPKDCTKKKLENKIKLIEGVIESLPTTHQSRPKDEVSILKNILETKYF